MTDLHDGLAARAAGTRGNSRARGVSISDDVADVLRRSECDGAVLRLPEGQLDRALYAAVDKTLRALGGRWDKRSRGHVFSEPVADALASALGNGFAVDQKKTLEQFFTPPTLAARLVDRLGLTADDHVLEPSAGDGALIDAALSRGCFVTAVELDERLAADLAKKLAMYHGCGVWQGDFLAWSPSARLPFSAVLMNPPFATGADVQHVLHAFQLLAPGGRLAAIMGEHAFTARDKRSVAFRNWLAAATAAVDQIPAGTFRLSGTNVATRMVYVEKQP